MTYRHLIAIGLVLPLISCSQPDPEKPSPDAQPETATAATPVQAPAPATAAGKPSATVARTSAPAPKLASIKPAEKSKPNPADAERIFKQAQEAIKGRDLGGALKKAEEALAANPKHRGALLLLAAIYQDKARIAQSQPFQSAQQSQQRDEFFLKSGALARRLRTAYSNLNPVETNIVSTALYNEGCALALARQADKAIASLNEAVDAGFPQVQSLETDADLASIRDKPAFKDLQKRAANLGKARIRAWAKQMLAEQKPFTFTFNRPDAMSNKVISSKEFKGKVVIVDLWATWCPPCREEVKVLVQLQKAYKKAGLEVVGMDFEGTPLKEAKATVYKFAKENGINYTCLLGDEKTKEQLPTFTAYPTLVFLDRTGRVRLQRLGYHPYEALEAIVKILLEEPGTTLDRT